MSHYQEFQLRKRLRPNIDYNEYIMLNPKTYLSRTKYSFPDIYDSTFYGEIFCCLLDFDNNNTGTRQLLMGNRNTKTSTNKYDTLIIDASKHTVVLDGAAFIKDLAVSAGPDIYMTYNFKGEYQDRPNHVFLLTQYKQYGYEYFHGGVFLNEQTRYFYPREKDIKQIISFWPVLPTKYEDKFGKGNYNIND